MDRGKWRGCTWSPGDEHDLIFEGWGGADWIASWFWGKLELMGYRTHIGRMRWEPGGCIRVRLLKEDGEQDAERFYSQSAIYCVTEHDEKWCRQAVKPVVSSYRDDDVLQASQAQLELQTEGATCTLTRGEDSYDDPGF